MPRVTEAMLAPMVSLQSKHTQFVLLRHFVHFLRHLFHSSIKEGFPSSCPYPAEHANMYKKRGKKLLVIRYFSSLLVIVFLKYIIKLPSHPWPGNQRYCKPKTSKAKEICIWHTLSFQRIHNLSGSISRKATTLYTEKKRAGEGERKVMGREGGILSQKLIYAALKGFLIQHKRVFLHCQVKYSWSITLPSSFR